MKLNPPKRSLSLLRWFCRTDYLEEIEGDLTEVFERESMESPVKARWKFRWSVFRYLRPLFIEKLKSVDQLNPTIMVRHNLLLTYRSFKRYKMTFLINLTGLSTGLACAFLIFMWVGDELSVDKFFENDKELYQVVEFQKNSDGIHNTPATPGPLAETMANELPEVKYGAVSSPNDLIDLKVGEKIISSPGIYTSKDYFRIFSYPFLEGDKTQPLNNINSIAISKSLAFSLFNTSANLVGRAITVNNEKEYQISAVFEDVPGNASLQFDWVLTLEIFATEESGRMSWGNNNMLTYLLMHEGTDIDQFNNKIKDFVPEHGGEEHVTLYITPYSDRYLYGTYENGIQTGGRIEYVQLFSIIAVFILGIACINFMNLSTAQASRRVKEIGIKKAIGSGRYSLIMQYLLESQFIVFLSLILAVGIIIYVLPQFNIITGKDIHFSLGISQALTLLGITVITGFLAGSYPAFFLSGFRPIDVLKGQINRSKWEKWAPKGLVVFQFSLSIILIVSVLVVYKQIDFIQTKNLGYDRENIMQFGNIGESPEQVDTYISEISKIPGIIDASTIGHRLVGDYYSSTSSAEWEGKQPDEVIEVEAVPVNFGLLELLDIQVVDGRSFSEEKNDNVTKIIINEAAVAAMGLENPVGKTISFWGTEMEVIGIAKDFHFRTLHESIKPQFFVLGTQYTWLTMAKIEAGREQEVIAALQAFHASVSPETAFEYEFMDDNFNAQYVAEQRVSTLSRYFAGIAVLISCLGLFGLAAFTAQRRRKEIGIRKVLGSSEFDIVRLLSSDFTKTVSVAIIIALPISYLMMVNWLEGYAFHIQLEWWYFASAGIISLLVAWITVSLQTIKAARINPTQSLKDD